MSSAAHRRGALRAAARPRQFSERHPIAYFSVSPAALARAEGTAAATGLDFSPASTGEFATRIRALRVPRPPPLLLGDDDFIANETPAVLPVVRHHHVLGSTPNSIDMADLATVTGLFTPLGDFALMGGPRYVAASRRQLL